MSGGPGRAPAARGDDGKGVCGVEAEIQDIGIPRNTVRNTVRNTIRNIIR